MKQNRHLLCLLFAAVIAVASVARADFKFGVYVNGSNSYSLTFGIDSDAWESPEPPPDPAGNIKYFYFLAHGEPTDMKLSELTDFQKAAQKFFTGNKATWTLRAEQNFDIVFGLESGSVSGKLTIRPADGSAAAIAINPVAHDDASATSYKVEAGSDKLYYIELYPNGQNPVPPAPPAVTAQIPRTAGAYTVPIVDGNTAFVTGSLAAYDDKGNALASTGISVSADGATITLPAGVDTTKLTSVAYLYTVDGSDAASVIATVTENGLVVNLASDKSLNVEPENEYTVEYEINCFDNAKLNKALSFPITFTFGNTDQAATGYAVNAAKVVCTGCSYNATAKTLTLTAAEATITISFSVAQDATNAKFNAFLDGVACPVVSLRIASGSGTCDFNGDGKLSNVDKFIFANFISAYNNAEGDLDALREAVEEDPGIIKGKQKVLANIDVDATLEALLEAASGDNALDFNGDGKLSNVDKFIFANFISAYNNAEGDLDALREAVEEDPSLIKGRQKVLQNIDVDAALERLLSLAANIVQ